jgi:hypothetical protein
MVYILMTFKGLIMCYTRHMPVNLANQEAEIRRIMIQRQPPENTSETLSQKTHHKKWLVERLKR